VKFQVLVDDNFHYMDEGERSLAGAFDRYDAALAKAKAIVRMSVEECAVGKESADEIIACYKMFGDDPWIHPTPEGVERFSAWDFAEVLARELVEGVS
jgi:hypothetical protein